MSFTNLKTGRLAKGLSQVEAAGRLKVSQSYLAMLEGGVRRLTPELARRAMRVYDLAPAILLHWGTKDWHICDAGIGSLRTLARFSSVLSLGKIWSLVSSRPSPGSY